MMNIRNLFLLFIMLCFSFAVIATEENEKKDVASKEQKTKNPKASIGKRGQVKTLEEFIPSENISADKPVAFPSDI